MPTVSYRPLAAFAAAGALAFTAGASLAQPPGQGPGPGQGQGPGQGSGQGPGGSQRTDLVQVLHLQPNQMGAYQALQRAGQPTPDEIARLRAASPQALAALRTPQRLDRISSALAVRAALFQRGADATRAFYAQLSPDQQQTFDRISAQPSSRGQQQQ